MLKHKMVTLIRKYKHARKKPNNCGSLHVKPLVRREHRLRVFSFILAIILQEIFLRLWRTVQTFCHISADISEQFVVSIYWKLDAALFSEASILQGVTFTSKNLMSKIRVLCERQQIPWKDIKMCYSKSNYCWTGHLLCCPRHIFGTRKFS